MNRFIRNFCNFPLLIGVTVVFLSFIPNLLCGVSLSIDYIIAVVVNSIILVLFLNYNKENAQLPSIIKKYCIAFSSIVSQFICIGESFYLVQDWSLCFGSFPFFVVWLFKTLLYSYIAYRIISLFVRWICTERSEKEDCRVDLRKLFLYNTITRVICQIIYFPCCFDYDGGFSLNKFLAPDQILTAHHPFFVQLVQISFYRLGQLLGNPTIGMAILTFLFIICGSFIVLYGLKSLLYMGCPSKWIKRVGLFWALFPLFPIININPTKDGFFSYAFLLYFITLLRICISKGKAFSSTRFLILHGIALLAVCLTRHQGIYIVVCELLALLIYYRGWRKRIILSSLPSILLFFAFTKILLPYWEVVPGGKQEVLGFAFKQTAYTLKCYPKDVTEEELASINTIMNADSIVSRYRYNSTDYVKGCYYQFTPTKKFTYGFLGIKKLDDAQEKENLKAYLKTWWSMLLRHPLCYLESQLGILSGYFYNQTHAIFGFDWVWMNAATTPGYAFWQNLTFTRISNVITYRLGQYPPFDWLFATPYYLWAATLFLLLILINKDYDGLVLFFPVFLSMCVLLICPVVDGRYTYPVVFSLPFIAMYVMKNHPKIRKNE